MSTQTPEPREKQEHETADGKWTTVKHAGICTKCSTYLPIGEKVLIARHDGKSWEAYCSQKCRDARQAVLALADQMEADAAALRKG